MVKGHIILNSFQWQILSILTGKQLKPALFLFQMTGVPYLVTQQSLALVLFQSCLISYLWCSTTACIDTMLTNPNLWITSTKTGNHLSIRRKPAMITTVRDTHRFALQSKHNVVYFIIVC